MQVTGKIQSDLKRFSRQPRVASPNRIPRTWIIVADQHIARIFAKAEKGLELIGEAAHDLSTDRVSSTDGTAPLSFMLQISDWLNQALWKDAFDRLVLIAAPQTLDELRQTMKRQLHARIIAEISQGHLLKLDNHALQSALINIIWF